MNWWTYLSIVLSCPKIGGGSKLDEIKTKQNIIRINKMPSEGHGILWFDSARGPSIDDKGICVGSSEIAVVYDKHN